MEEGGAVEMSAEGPYELPKGWEWTTLGEIQLNKSKSIAPNKEPNTIFELYSVPAFRTGKPDVISGKEIGSNKQIVEEGTVLLCKINPHINRVWIVDNHSLFQKIASTEWTPFYMQNCIYSKYLCYFMQNDSFRDFLASNASGVGGSLMRIKPATFSQYPFPLPPLPEQRRIVTRIEELFTQLDAGISALKTSQAQLKRYRQSVLKAAVEGKLTEKWRADHPDMEPASALLERIGKERRAKWEEDELAKMVAKGKRPKNDRWKQKYKAPLMPKTEGLPELPKGWEWTNIQQIGNVSGGLTKNRNRDMYPEKMPYLRVANVYANELRLDDIQRIGIKDAEIDKLLLQDGDLLLVEGNGSPEQIGRVAIWTSKISPCVHQNHIIKVRPSPVDIGEFVLYWLLSNGGREQIARVASSTSGLYTLSISKVSSLPVPLPPLAEQHEIVSEIERRLSVADQAEATIAANLKHAARLRQSILKKAFRGELVPQDTNDEPASILLERIRAERAKSPPKKRRGRPRKNSGQKELI